MNSPSEIRFLAKGSFFNSSAEIFQKRRVVTIGTARSVKRMFGPASPFIQLVGYHLEIRVFIKSFGQFWRAEEVDWFPGKGNKNAFRLLGRQGTNLPGVRLADFRFMQGIYILYGNHGPYYTGLTMEQGLGKRLQDHLSDQHGEKWDRFSWFGFQKVLKRKDKFNICELRNLAGIAVGEPTTVIRDVEALLIRAMGLTNISQTQFAKGDEWFQVYDHEVVHYLEKVRKK